MSGDPLTIATAIITLTNTLARVISVLETFARAETRIAEFRRDLTLTRGVLEFLQQQLDADRPPTLHRDGTNNGDAGINLWGVLGDNVAQLQLDLDTMLRQLEALGGPLGTDTRIGRLIARGQVTWRMSYLEAMQERIRSNRMQLELVHITLRHGTNGRRQSLPGRRASDDSVVAAAFLRQLLTRESGPLPSPRPEVQDKIIKAIQGGQRRELESLLRDVSPNFHTTVNGKERSPLDIAAVVGNLAIVHLLISSGARIDCCGGGEDTPLTLAISHRHAVVALALIRRGANIVLADRKERTPLHHAARQNLYAVVQVLINNGADVNAVDMAGLTPLMEAVRRNDREIQPSDTNVLRVLLRNGANSEIGTFRDHYTPVHHAAALAQLNDLEVMLAAVSSDGMMPLIVDSLDRTPLWFAAHNGHLDAVQLLVRFGAGQHIDHLTRDPNCPTTLWAMAASTSLTTLEGIDTLLALNANPDIQRPTTGETLLHRAIQNDNLPLLHLLLTHNANPLIKDNNNLTPIHHAARAGNLEALTHLLSHATLTTTTTTTNGTTPNDLTTTPHPSTPPPHPHSPQTHGSDLNQPPTPLHLASQNGHDFLLPLLIQKYQISSPHATDQDGNTALHLACSNGHILCAAYLLGCGVNLEARNDEGLTALGVAARRGQVGVVGWLVRMGAVVHGIGIGISTGIEEGVGVGEVGNGEGLTEWVRVMGLEARVGERVLEMLRGADDGEGGRWRRGVQFFVKMVRGRDGSR